MPLIVPSGALRSRHKLGIRHLARPIRGVESAGRRESFAEVRRRCRKRAQECRQRYK